MPQPVESPVATTLSGKSTPVAVNVAVEAPARLAVSVLLPGVGPRFHAPTRAMPAASEVGLPPVTLPPPDATAKLTLSPPIGLPNASVTLTAGAIGTAAPTAARCWSPSTTARSDGGPTTPVALN